MSLATWLRLRLDIQLKLYTHTHSCLCCDCIDFSLKAIYAPLKSTSFFISYF